MLSKFRKIKTKQKGALLLELLIVISLLVVILSVSSDAVFLSMKSNKVSGERDMANALASETFESLHSVSEGSWQNIYGLTKNTAHYYIKQVNGKWTVEAGDEIIILNNITYTRYFTIDNVSRDSFTRNIIINPTDYIGNYSSNNYSVAEDDPSTQKVTVSVSWLAEDPVLISQYLFRWKNKICGQSGWASGFPGNDVKNCTDTSYDTKDAEVDSTGGILKLQ